jgi:surface antigen
MRPINKSFVAVALSSVALFSATRGTSSAASTPIASNPADPDEQLRAQDILQLLTPNPSRPDTASVTAEVPARALAGGRARRMLTAVALVAGLCGGAIAIDTPLASAAFAGPVCEGWSGCNVAPYTSHNYQNEMYFSYWGMTIGTQCTNYAAFVESDVYGAPTPNYALGDAANWANAAQDHGVTVNQTPTVGSVAQWTPDPPSIGSDGHVAIVEEVGPNDSYIVVSQDNWTSDTNDYGWALILANTPNQGQPWPDSFIHFPTTKLPPTLSDTQPDRLIQSTANLYWTADQTLDGNSQADVYRASKDNEPGQERILYQKSQPTSTPVDFEAITYANVGGNWYGYFVANYPGQNKSQIMRVPLAGGGAVVLANSPAVIANRDLVTDGSFLYWADADGIRRMAIAGGPVQTLVSGPTFAHLGLDGPVLYYTSANSILHVPTSGGASTTVVTAASAITAMYPPSPNDANVYWGETNGSVSLFPGPYDSAYPLQAPGAGVSITSVSVAGNYILWGERLPGGYRVVGYDNGNFVSVPTSGPPVDVQGDTGAWYWGASDLEKFTL